MKAAGDRNQVDRPQRRHTDGAFTEAVKHIPRKELARRRQERIEQLRAEMRGDSIDHIDGDQLHMQFEPMPPGQDILESAEFDRSKLPYWNRDL